MNILVTNDDGVQAPGLRALVNSLPSWANVLIAGPATEKSAMSHAISLKDKLKIESLTQDGKPCYAVHGTPADSVKFAFSEFLNFKPDLVISGINQGANTGVSVYYSGTVAAAREAFINHVPAVAISLASKTFSDFSASCEMMHLLLNAYQAKKIPLETLLNVNVPALRWAEIKGIRITRQAPSRFVEEFIPEGESEGKKIFSLAGAIELASSDGTSDEEAILDGYISITPLKLDLTHLEVMKDMNRWLEDLKTGKC